MSGQSAVADVPVIETWAQLKNDVNSILIDVRTRAEWAFVGLPDLEAIGKRVLTVEWQTFPDSRVDPAFVGKLSQLLKDGGVGTESDLFFICRSGGRSRMAAEAMVAAGYTRCHNVAEGFEGPLDPTRHRGSVAGWKAAGLPWAQG